jgi:putative addiction module component (TIGR02574 family)
MSAVVAEIESKIRTLSLEDRAELIRALIGELDGPADAEVEHLWREEARRRHAEMAQGKVKPVPEDQVFERLRIRLKR